MNPDAELILLREFYKRWTEYHKLPANATLQVKKLAIEAVRQAHEAVQRVQYDDWMIATAERRKARAG